MTRNRATTGRGTVAGVVAALAGAALAGAVLAGCGQLLPAVDQTGTATAGGGSTPPAVAVTGPTTGPAAPDATSVAPSVRVRPGVPSSLVTAGHVPQPPPQLAKGENISAPLVWDAAAEAAARAVAHAAMVAYARPTVPAQKWRHDMSKFLTTHALPGYGRFQPQYLTVKTVTGPAVLDADRSNPYWVWSTVPTNDGKYRVRLNRLKAGAPWLVDVVEPAQLKH